MIYAYTDEDDFVVMQSGEPLDVAYAEHQIEGKVRADTAPSPVHRLKIVASAAVWVDPRDITQARAAKISEINAAWDAANASHFVYSGKQISVKPEDLINLWGTNGYVSLMADLPPGWAGGWKCMDNSYVAIADVATWKAFYTAFAAQGTGNFAHAQELKAQVAAASTIAGIDSIHW